MKKQWQISDPDPKIVRNVSHDTGCSLLMARLLVNRGIVSKTQAARFLTPTFQTLTSPMEMADMDVAVRAIHQSLMGNEKILVFGDYDADGITATAVLVSFLEDCGAKISYHIPYRMTDGYGMGQNFIRDRAIPAGIQLIITVDCGSSDGKAISFARNAGIHTIVTDHHPVGNIPEDALAVVNPTRIDCTAKVDHLAGVGVAFYLIVALRTYLRKKKFWESRKEPNLKELCDLVALGTIADVAPMIRENRVLTVAGLQQINRKVRPGIEALMRIGGILNIPVTEETISFQLAPRLNAAGRLVHAQMACELLLTKERKKAAHLAKALCRINSRRQTMEGELLEIISTDLATHPEKLERPVLVVHGTNWHEGILGIVASRLTRKYNRPSFVIGTRNGKGKGSGRSVEGIDLSVALDRCADLLDRYGGHPMAAGVSIEPTRIEAFASRMVEVVDKMTAEGGIDRTLPIDARFSLADITPDLMGHLEQLGPFGRKNPYPRFVDDRIRVHSCKRIGGNHQKMVLSANDGKGEKLPAIHFNVSDDLPAPAHVSAVAYRPQWNFWKGRKQLQLLIEDTAAEPLDLD